MTANNDSPRRHSQVLHRWMAALCVSLLSPLLICCSSNTPHPTGPITIGAVFPLTGAQANGDELAGVQLAVGLVNQDGGIRGRKVSIQPEDAVSPDLASTAVDKLVDQGISIIIGTYSSPLALAASARASSRGATYVEVGAVADAITQRGLSGILRTGADGSMLGSEAASFAHDFVVPGLHLATDSARVVVMFEGDQYGSSVAYGAVEEAAQVGLNVVDVITYDAANADFDQLASLLAADRPDVILSAAYLTDAVSIRQAATRYGVAVKAIVGTSSTYTGPAFSDQLGQAAVGIFSVDKPDDSLNPGALRPEARDLLARADSAYRQTTGRAINSEVMAGFAGSWTLFHEILPLATSLTSGDIWKAAMAVDVPSGSEINGSGVKFVPTGQANAGQNERSTSVVWEWIGVGTRSIVYPPAAAKVPAQIEPLTS